MTSRILAIDTASEFGSVAVVANYELVGAVEIRSTEGFGHILFTEIQRLLEKHGLRISEIDCFASSSGPGSFTGIRVGLAAVKGLGEALKKPVVAVSNLQAVAWYGSKPLRATLLDARRGEFYGAVYSEELELISPETVGDLQEWLDTLPLGELEFVSTGPLPLRANLHGTRFEQVPISMVPRALGEAVGRIAARRFARGQVTAAVSADANYVRRSDAELYWREF